MAGLACAEGLVQRGHDVVLLDKGRGPGGRMSTRRLQTSRGEAHFDHGAQYFTVRDQGFLSQVQDWISKGVVAPWPAAGTDAYVGVPAMNAPVRQMAARHTVHWSTLVTEVQPLGLGWHLSVENGDPFEVDLVVIATPAEQTAALLAGVAPELAARARAATSEPCWTLMLAFSEPIAEARDCFTGNDVIGWAARNSAKPGRTGPECWVIQATPDWSRLHLESHPDEIVLELTAAFSSAIDAALPASIGLAAHRWRFARSAAEGSGAILDRDRCLGVCGDWLIGPRVEAAWVSGAGLADRIGTASSLSGAV